MLKGYGDVVGITICHISGRLNSVNEDYCIIYQSARIVGASHAFYLLDQPVMGESRNG